MAAQPYTKADLELGPGRLDGGNADIPELFAQCSQGGSGGPATSVRNPCLTGILHSPLSQCGLAPWSSAGISKTRKSRTCYTAPLPFHGGSSPVGRASKIKGLLPISLVQLPMWGVFGE